MPITLIRSNKDNTIHGADNDRKTGCGIRLQGNSGYSREGEMSDITDLTCERCKEVFATKMIRESNREELRLAREERKRFARAKKQGIVSESTYEEYVLKREAEASAKRDSKVQPNTSELPPLKADMPENTSSSQYQQSSGSYAQPTAPYAQPTTIPYGQPTAPYAQPTTVYPGYEQSVQSVPQYNNNSIPQYQPYQSQQNELKSSNVPEVKKNSSADDDFLAQFIVKPNPVSEEHVPDIKQQSYNTASNIISAADDILSQFETNTEQEQEQESPSVSPSVKGDASSFYSNQIPLVEAEYVSSHEISSAPNSEFGSVTVNKSEDTIDDFAIPEVPQINPVYQQYTKQSAASQALFPDQFSSNKSQNNDSSFDSIEVPDISDINSVPLSQPAYQQSSSFQFDSLDVQSPVNEFEQPQVSQPLPVAPPVDDFADISSEQSQINQPISAVPAVDDISDISLIQPQDNSQPPFVSPVSEFVSIVPPANEFTSAVPPVISNVQSTADEFTAVSSASGFTMPNQFIVPPSMQQDAVSAAPYSSYQQQIMYGSSGSLQNTYTSTPVESQPDLSQFNNSFNQKYSSAAQSYNNNINSGSLQNQFKNTNMYSNSDISNANNNSAGIAPVLNEEDQIKKKPIPVLFNSQNDTPMVDSIEEALRQLGAGGSSEEKNKTSEKEEIVPDFVPYVPSSSKTLYNDPPVKNYSNQSKRVISPKDAKKLAKIDAKFHKELVERGFSPSELKSQRRGK